MTLSRRHFLASLTAVLAAPRLLPAPGAGVSASAPGPAPAEDGVFATSTSGTSEFPGQADLSSWIPGPRRDGLHPDSNILGPGVRTS